MILLLQRLQTKSGYWEDMSVPVRKEILPRRAPARVEDPREVAAMLASLGEPGTFRFVTDEGEMGRILIRKVETHEWEIIP